MEDMGINIDFWRDRRTFVTGATGLVGGTLVKRLLKAKAQVVCLVRDWVPQSELLKAEILSKVTLVSGNVCDPELLERILGEYEIDTVMHLAAQTIVGIANRNPVSTFETNIRGAWALFEACRRSPLVKQVVFASSDKAYGEALTLPYNEETPLNGRYPYDASKACADILAQSYARSFDLPVVITRCGNFFGGGDLNWNRIVPGTIKSVLAGEKPLIRSNGNYVRDYFYTEDGANAYMLLAEKLSLQRDLKGEAFNFSNESQATVLELVKTIVKLLGADLKPVILNEANHEIENQRLDSTKARKRLGWEPLFSLEEGLKRTIEWYKEFLKK